jgi:hypothetical protein
VDEPSAERTCDVPKDKAVLLPIISAEADNIPEQTDKSEQGMIKSAKSGNDYAAISVRVDGTKLNINEDPKFRATSGFLNMTLPEHNIWEEKERPGTYKGVTEGYFLFLKPLSEGNHTLYYEAAINPPNPNVYDKIAGNRFRYDQFFQTDCYKYHLIRILLLVSSHQ